MSSDPTFPETVCTSYFSAAGRPLLKLPNPPPSFSMTVILSTLGEPEYFIEVTGHSVERGGQPGLGPIPIKLDENRSVSVFVDDIRPTYVISPSSPVTVIRNVPCSSSGFPAQDWAISTIAVSDSRNFVDSIDYWFSRAPNAGDEYDADLVIFATREANDTVARFRQRSRVKCSLHRPFLFASSFSDVGSFSGPLKISDTSGNTYTGSDATCTVGHESFLVQILLPIRNSNELKRVPALWSSGTEDLSMCAIDTSLYLSDTMKFKVKKREVDFGGEAVEVAEDVVEG